MDFLDICTYMFLAVCGVNVVFHLYRYGTEKNFVRRGTHMQMIFLWLMNSVATMCVSSVLRPILPDYFTTELPPLVDPSLVTSPELAPAGALIGSVALLAGGAATVFLRLRQPKEIEPPVDDVPAVEGSAEVVDDPTRRQRAIEVVDTIKSDYGARMCDVVDLVELHALFDSKVETTRAFESALMTIQDMDLDTAPLDQVVRQSERLQTRWDAALAYAKALGMDGLTTDQKLANRAQGLARRAAGSSSEHERSVALGKLQAIFDVLGVVLPKRAAEALEAGRIFEIEAPAG